MRRIMVPPGKIFLSEEPSEMVVLLGSCVSVTMYCRRHKIGSVSHSVLPTGPERDIRYVDSSIREMKDWFASQLIKPNEIEVSLFGGGNMFYSRHIKLKMMSIGRQNINKAIEIIKAEGFYIIRGDIGGPVGRKIFFNSNTGRIIMKRTGNICKSNEKNQSRYSKRDLPLHFR